MNDVLALLGIERWQLRNPNSWENLQNSLKKCQLCALAKTRNNLVLGEGNLNPDVVFIGEAPGEQEDLQGRPFVGKAGQLLDQMLKAIQLTRKNIYIANILKCRPPNNRNPFPAEIKNCTVYLQQQLLLLKPKCLVAVGKISANYLLQTNAPMSELRGNWFNYQLGEQIIPLFVIYHPAYLLRSPRDKKIAYEDLLQLSKRINTLQIY